MGNYLVNDLGGPLTLSTGTATTHTTTIVPTKSKAQGGLQAITMVMSGSAKTFTNVVGTGVVIVGTATALSDATNGASMGTIYFTCATAGSVSVTLTTSSLAATSIQAFFQEWYTDLLNPTWSLAQTVNVVNLATTVNPVTGSVNTVEGDFVSNVLVPISAIASYTAPGSIDKSVFYDVTSGAIFAGCYPTPALATTLGLPQAGSAGCRTQTGFTATMTGNATSVYEIQCTVLRPAGSQSPASFTPAVY